MPFLNLNFAPFHLNFWLRLWVAHIIVGANLLVVGTTCGSYEKKLRRAHGRGGTRLIDTAKEKPKIFNYLRRDMKVEKSQDKNI